MNIRDAAQGQYTYRVTTQESDCDGINAYPYALGKVFTQSSDVESPLPLYQQSGFLNTNEETDQGGAEQIGFVAGAQINQVVESEGPDLTGLCSTAQEQCATAGAHPLCAPAVSLCDISQQQAWQAYDVNGDACVGESDIVAVREHVNDSSDSSDRFDVNDDGSVDILDVITVTQYVDDSANSQNVCDEAQPQQNQRPQTWQNPDNQYDVNHDGEVGLDDVQSLFAFFRDEQIGDPPVEFSESRTPEDDQMYEQVFLPYGYVDIDGNSQVDLDDVSKLYNHLGVSGEVESFWQNPVNQYDVNHDGAVTLSDMHNLYAFARDDEVGELPVRFDIDEFPGNKQFYRLFFEPYGYVNVNGDRQIGLEDIAQLYAHMKGTEEVASFWQNPDNQYDVNHDGRANLADIENVYAFFQDEQTGSLPVIFDSNDTPADVQMYDVFFEPYGYVNVDGDREIGLEDVAQLYAHLSGTQEVESIWQNPVNQYDVNHDDSVNSEDVQALEEAIPAWRNLAGSERLSGDILDDRAYYFYRRFGYVDVNADNRVTADDTNAVKGVVEGER